MESTTPQETNQQFLEGSSVGSIRACLDGCQAAYLGVAIGRGLAPNWDRTLQNCTSHVAHSVIPLYTNLKPNKPDVGLWGLKPWQKRHGFLVQGTC